MTPIYSTITDIRTAVAAERALGQRIAFVPTMGALHAGHAELIRLARSHAACVVVSVFVNPTQFGPTEDYARYPRTLEADAALVEANGATVMFVPTPAEMYPPGCRTVVDVPGLDAVLCGLRRPGHFRGVCTVVLKLFNIVRPDLAVFGAKDAQQSIILTRMVRDLDLPIEMVIAPTVREPDGLAMSSRNRYLGAAERAVAPQIYAALRGTADRLTAGERTTGVLETGLRQQLQLIPGARVDYAEILDAESLTPMPNTTRPMLIAAAVFLGTTRLIDNIVIR